MTSQVLEPRGTISQVESHLARAGSAEGQCREIQWFVQSLRDHVAESQRVTSGDLRSGLSVTLDQGLRGEWPGKWLHSGHKGFQTFPV